MRLIDADTLYEFLTEQREKETGAYSKGRNVGLNIARSALHDKTITPTIAPPPNLALTLDELLEMDGEPVYCISDYEITVSGEKGHRFHAEGWGIVTGTDLKDQGFIVGTAHIYHLEHYGKTWLAYRRKPEEVQRG